MLGYKLLAALLILPLSQITLSIHISAQTAAPKVLPGTAPLETTSDITSDLVAGVDRFLLKQLAQAPEARQQHWATLVQPELDKPNPAVAQLSTMIGLRDARVSHPQLVIERPTRATTAYAAGKNWTAELARWPVHSDLDAAGLYVKPLDGPIKFRAVIIPDAGQTPEQLIGVGQGSEKVAAWGAMLAALGGEVVVTTPVSRHREARRGRAVMTDEEFLYRSAFELGRHVLGYQVNETLSAIEALEVADDTAPNNANLPMVVIGWGEGGWIALHAAAVSPRIDAVCVSGHFQARENLWQEPIHRNMHGLLNKFGDAELAAIIAPRHVIIDAIAGPQVEIGGDGGAPGRLSGPTLQAAQAELARTQKILQPHQLQTRVQLITPAKQPTLDGASIESIAAALAAVKLPNTPTAKDIENTQSAAVQTPDARLVSIDARRHSMLDKYDRFSQRLLEHAVDERTAYWKDLKTDSLDSFKATVEPYREKFAKDVIGRWDMPLSAPQPRSRLVYEQPKWLGYEVVMDVFPDVIAYGVLLLPRDQAAGERRPCVVFQHGLEGRPQDCIVGDHPAYHDVAARLAERGFVVFAPQNLYIFHDRFRTLQRKSNPLGKTLFSTIVPQHQQICNWLASQPQVDSSRIGFYGLSYGGKSAMRIPPLVPQYCLSICSADFNDWVWKNASTHAPQSYMWTMEYEIFEFDLGSRFNYADMATLIAPRPFMVERGHFDGVAPDDRVAAEFAKVRHLYSAKLGLTDAARLEWFVGPHTINGQGTYDFLHEKLNYPKPADRSSR
ncbi:MAG: dienelactone hydrolase family protein [Pirellulaceae bacterium]|nr:dienelactone hydrolase family protein [Pirellulaceae bacterium]